MLIRNIFCMVVCSLSILSGVATASNRISMDDYDAVLEKVKRKCPPIKGVPLPTAEDFKVIEEEIGQLDGQLRQFLKECGNLNFKAYDIARAHRTEKYPESKLIRLHRKFEKETKGELKYHAFCYDNANYFCINSKTGIVRYWQHDYDPPKLSPRKTDQWPNFKRWLEDILVPAQERY